MNNKIFYKMIQSTLKMIDISLNQLENEALKIEENMKKLEQLKKQNMIYLIILIFILFCESCLFIKMLFF